MIEHVGSKVIISGMNILVSRSYCQLFEKNDFYLFILSLKVPYLLFIDQKRFGLCNANIIRAKAFYSQASHTFI